MSTAKFHAYFRKFGPFSVSSTKNLTMRSFEKFTFTYCKVYFPLLEKILRDAAYIYVYVIP